MDKDIFYHHIGIPMFKGSANNWWLRSPNSGNSNNFCNVNSDGTANNNNANNSNGVCAGFHGHGNQAMRITEYSTIIKILIIGKISIII